MGAASLRICLVLSTRGFALGGLETIADHLAAGLAARGHQVTLLAGVTPGRPRRGGCPAGVERVAIPLLPRTSPLLRGLARLLRCSALNLQSLGFFLGVLASGRARRRLDESHVTVTFLEGEAVLFSRYLAGRGRGSVYYYSGAIDRRWAARDRSTLRVAISQFIADRSLQDRLCPIDGVVRPGVPAELLERPMAASRPGEAGRLLSVARLEPNKRVDWLLPLVEALVPRFPSVTLRLVGDGPDRPRLERAARVLGGRVTLLGAVEPALVYDELRQADLFLFPSAYESFGIAPLEAMAAGLPVIGSDLPALREATGGCACLLPPHDRGAWIEIARQLLSDAALRGELARQGRAWAANWTWERAVEHFEPFLFRAADGSPTARPSSHGGPG